MILSGLICHRISAQDTIPQVKVISRVDDGKVMLRWAVSTPVAWQKANTYGYTIERFTVKRNGQLLAEPEKKKINTTPIQPQPLLAWKNVVQTSDYAAIMAQALYGEKFQVENMQQSGIAQIINKAKESEQRFSFALLAADMDFETAKMAGLGYVDTDIQEGEIYFYSIKTAIPQEIMQVGTGSIYVDPSKEEDLPKPIALTAVPQDKSILLVWDYESFKAIYTTYYIERSDNGTHFNRLEGAPLVNMDNTSKTTAVRRMYYTDTLSQNDKTYHYRVIGISPFGEHGPPSEIVTTQGIKKLEATPHISKTEFDASGAIQVYWDFEKEAESEITGFELNWAPQEKGPYTVAKTAISPKSRKTIFKEVAPSNYFKVTAIGKNNQKTTSFAAFAQAVDSIPPASPVGLRGTVDTLGIVKLQWQANIERDILGYRVYKGSLEKEELVQITVSPIPENTFVDTVQVKSLNKKVFYQVIAVDKRYNMSGYSEKIILKKPDVVPPSSPIFSAYTVKEDGIHLHWINSSSNDVVEHQLYRQNTTEAKKGWELIFKTDTITKYTDTNSKSGIQYRYAIFARDETGLQSSPSTPLTITMQRNTRQQVVKNFKGVVDRLVEKIDLSWKVTDEQVSEVWIYKNKKGEAPALFKQLPSKIKNITDTNVSPNTDYTYQIKAILKKGYSTLETVNITY
jgi:fibronectin type 3 domain-containing protein